MKRLALIIGVGSYDHALNLPGAVVDAQKLFDILIDKRFGNYDKNFSKIVLSPNLIGFRSALEKALFIINDIDVFTFAFSGHGTYHRGSYYLCPSDVRLDRISATAMPVSHLFSLLNDVQPKQTNIIIDACNAGGMVGDLSALLKPETLGSSATPGVSLFASAMRDEKAGEDARGGYATSLMTEIITGVRRVSGVETPYLDLLSIGQAISDEFRKAGRAQTPAVWAFNLTSTSTFTRNPHHGAGHEGGPDDWQPVALRHAPFAALGAARERLWDAYLRLNRPGEPAWLATLLAECLEQVSKEAGGDQEATPLLLGLSETLPARAAQSGNTFAEAETLAACVVAALPYAVKERSSKFFFQQSLMRMLDALRSAFDKLASSIEENRFCLMSPSGAPGDFYFLPLRLSRILGWIGLTHILQKQCCGRSYMDDTSSVKIIKSIAEHYAGSLVTVSEEQAPYIYLYTKAIYDKDAEGERHNIFRHWIADFFRRKGNILRSKARGEEALHYIFASHAENYTPIEKELARPTELAAVLMYWSAAFGMHDEIDPHMVDLDHLSVNIFIPEDLTHFAEERIRGGVNITMQIGSEAGLGIFELEDFTSIFEKYGSKRIEAVKYREDEVIRVAAVAASLLFPNRVPWFLHGKLEPA